MIVEDRCLLHVPENPFNNVNSVRIVGNDGDVPHGSYRS